jgi:hypothetical protein
LAKKLSHESANKASADAAKARKQLRQSKHVAANNAKASAAALLRKLIHGE